MPFELNFKTFFQDFNPSKFVVYTCLLIFSLLFALRLDNTISWSYWCVFLPIWIWKLLVISGALIGSWVWWRHPQYRMEGDAYVQYKAMVICTGMHLVLLMFELLACYKLEGGQVFWILVFIPLIFMSIISIGICVWAVKHERSFELELFFSVNILQFIFLALRLDNFIRWSWGIQRVLYWFVFAPQIVLIPVWIVMSVALIGVLYAIILAIILLRSPDIIPEQRRGNVFSAVGYTFMVLPLFVFQVLLVYKEDRIHNYSYMAVTLPLFLSFITLMLTSFGTKAGNQWWFGLRREFCPWLLGVCPVLQEYGNISYKIQADDGASSEQEPADQNMSTKRKCAPPLTKKGVHTEEVQRADVSILTIDVPD